MTTERIVEVTPELAQRVEVLRYKADPKLGFQRELDYDRTRLIIKAAKEDVFIPPIFIGELPDKRLILIDGQHRLHAYKMQKFPLKAIVYQEDSVKSAAAQFIATNANGVRVSLGFRLNVDPGPDAKWMRDLSDKHETNPRLVYNIVVGIVGKSKFNADGRRVNKHAKDLCERILEFWARDKRWNDRAHLFSSVAVLKIVGTFAGESTNPTETIKFLQNMDWTKRSRLGAVTGSSWVFQDKMYRMLYRKMAVAGKLHHAKPKDAKKKLASAKGAMTRRTA